MNKEDKKLRKHLVDEMMKVSKTNPDVMYYMEALMKSYEELEKKNIDLSQQLLSKKISDKDIEYKKRMEIQQELDKYKNIADELEKYFIDMFNRTQDTKYLDDLQKLKELKGSDN